MSEYMENQGRGRRRKWNIERMAAMADLMGVIAAIIGVLFHGLSLCPNWWAR